MGRLQERIQELRDKARLKLEVRKDEKTAWIYRQGWEDHERLVCLKDHPAAVKQRRTCQP